MSEKKHTSITFKSPNQRLGDLAFRVVPVHFKTPVREAFLQIINMDEPQIIPVVDDENFVVGQLCRKDFIENTILGKYGYGIHLNFKRCICEVMKEPKYVFESHEKVEDVALKIKNSKKLPEDIIVVENGKLIGSVAVSDILESLAQMTILLMKDSNPLTGLPGNWALKNEVERRISNGEKFELIYIDINNFKPYNDHYGFAKGDEVIFVLGEIISNIAQRYEGLFPGHIGGDDFIVVCPKDTSMQVAQEIKKRFEKHLPRLHGEDYQRGFYISKDRSGLKKKFPLLSLSFAIVGNEKRNIASYAHLASIASEVKAKAKSLAKESQSSVIFKDRRSDESASLKEALSLSEIILDIYFQPVVDISSHKVIGFEALVRGKAIGMDKLIPPKVLFEIAEMENRFLELDRTCRDLAMKKFKEFELERDFLLFLNISSEAVDLGIVGTAWMRKRAEYYGIKPETVVIEINEDRIQNVDNLISFINKYRSYRFLIAMDDFGIDDSNIERFLITEPNYVKLAKNLIESIHINIRKQKLLEVMKLLSEKFNVPLIIEGVEELKDAYYLKQAGFTLAQGYLFAHPNPDPKRALLLAQENLKKCCMEIKSTKGIRLNNSQMI